MEFRPPVIRRAIIRSAQPLVLMHLRSPSAEVERLLVNVMLSGYRVLDPRRRDDSNQRVMLGRIHPQLVEEAVYLAQKKPAQTPVVGFSALPSEASNAVVGSVARKDARVDSVEADSPSVAEFSPIAERDWLESAEATLGVADRLLSGGFAAEMNPSDRFLEVTSSVAWDATLTGSDLMVQPTYQRIYRAIRRRLARASAASVVSAVMLAASILLVMTWRTTVWIRSIGERRMRVEVAESVFSTAEVATIVAAAIPEEGVKPAVSAVASTQMPPAVAQAVPVRPTGAIDEATKVDPVAEMGAAQTVASATGANAANAAKLAELAGEAVQAAGVEGASSAAVASADVATPIAALMPKVDQSLMPMVADPSVDSLAVAESTVPSAAASTVVASATTKPEPTTAGSATTAGSVADVPDADAPKKAADERLGMEMLGLVEPGNGIGGLPVAKIEKLPVLPEENLLGSARLRVESAARAIR
ncbi:MAG TPA: hypothetical protein DDZ51_06670, partial [Planctomycetaceae bacterium]|nr:hypothetical protein [Planctomycetaceae bacterium]